MPHFDQKGGYAGPVSEFQKPGWMSEQDRAIAAQDEKEREKYLTLESQRELQRFQTRRPAPPPPFAPKTPTGSIDPTKVANLVGAIHERGLHLNRSALIDKGKEKFAELLALNRALRKQLPLNVEPTSFGQLTAWCQNLFLSQVPKLDPGLQWLGQKLPEAARIRSLDDCWKSEPDPLVIAIYKHWQAFKSLVFGQSLLDAADAENRIRSPLWSNALHACSADRRLELLGGWSQFVVPPAGEVFILIDLENLLLSVVSWLSEDPILAAAITEPGYMYEAAREITGKRAPGEREVAKVRKLVEAFSLGLDGHAGDRPALESWSYLNGAERDFTKVRHLLAPIRKRFERTAAWHSQAISAALKPIPTHYDGVQCEFDSANIDRASITRSLAR